MQYLVLISGAALLISSLAWASPPAVGLAGPAKNCLTCHASNGPWTEGPDLIIDLVDKATGRSLRQDDGSFLVTCRRDSATTFMALLGYRQNGTTEMPHRNGWIFIDPATIGTPAVSKFAPGWEINIPFGCRITGDKTAGLENATLSAAPITVRPTGQAQNGEVSLQALLTRGDVVKGEPKTTLLQNYYERPVHLRVVD